MNTNEKDGKYCDGIFIAYIGLICLLMFSSFMVGEIYSYAQAKGDQGGFKRGQLEAMQGQWHYAPQVIVATNWVYTNYVKVINGVPESLKVDIRAIRYNFGLTNELKSVMFISQ